VLSNQDSRAIAGFHPGVPKPAVLMAWDFLIKLRPLYPRLTERLPRARDVPLIQSPASELAADDGKLASPHLAASPRRPHCEPRDQSSRQG
jgi:hypothetical protein